MTHSGRYISEPGLFRLEIEQRLRDIPARGTLTVLVDEMQKLPGLLNEVHYLIESHKSRGQSLLTGSSARKLKRSGANLLAGRAWTLKLHPLSSQEVEPDLRKALTIGTLPGFYQETLSSARRSLKAYVETYLKEEVIQELLVRKIDHFMRLLDIAGTGQRRTRKLFLHCPGQRRQRENRAGVFRHTGGYPRCFPRGRLESFGTQTIAPQPRNIISLIAAC